MFKVSVPGSVMLLGEHAVLQGFPSVVAAVQDRLSVNLIPRSDEKIFINSNLISCETNIVSLNMLGTLRFVQAACARFKGQFPSGFDLTISSQFSDKMGLGSSAAITVAMIAVLQKWLNNAWNLNEIYQESVVTHRYVQSVGSGADIAASTFGGVISYTAQPFSMEKLASDIPIQLIYVGYKTPTVEVIRKVKDHFAKQPEILKTLYAKIGDCSRRGIEAIKRKSFRTLGKIFSEHQQYQKQLGVSDALMDRIIAQVNQLPNVLGAKISGAGLGDCIVVLGELTKNYFPTNEEQKEKNIMQLTVKISPVGVLDETA